ncbi:MAG: hypothetical protein HGGPFJEG_01202 [Ignavibacteria bacterium]|nr:hypothetical protein [Ignavibacteria bacterium]
MVYSKSIELVIKDNPEIRPFIDSYVKEFPDDKKFLTLFLPSFDISLDRLIHLLKERKFGQRIVTVYNGDRTDYTELVYDQNRI